MPLASQFLPSLKMQNRGSRLEAQGLATHKYAHLSQMFHALPQVQDSQTCLAQTRGKLYLILPLCLETAPSPIPGADPEPGVEGLLLLFRLAAWSYGLALP